ncbi:hypothetical protein [Flavobacterium suaedae]|uniref:hypothetical protein n=1 Tax=Flavobacterium suaedae TaxID=1767027 RepID=UPI001664516A|nr:hypothetical protein [Flavobacterium suaedae]
MSDTPKQPKYYKELLQIPVWTAAISFIIGTFLFGLYKVDNHNEKILIIGFYYVSFAFFINLVVFLIMVILSFIFRNHQTEILKYASIQLTNIPIVILYLFLIFSN